jgi:hypothetical protein
MSRSREKLYPPTLAQLFEPPEDHLGCFGWICGYSADADFLDLAVERFTRLTQMQRARVGQVSLALMLDPGNEPIRFCDAPGIAHLPIRSTDNKAFALMHAKVALLGFRHENDARSWTLRLVVSTGNWTQQTIEESLDAAWSVDVRSDELETGDADMRQRCSDIEAARSLFSWLTEQYDTRLLDAQPKEFPGDAAIARVRVDEWLDLCATKGRRHTPRFFDNRKRSLFAQLTSKIRSHCDESARNYLAMGSGYYESAGDGAVPTVIAEIASALQAEGLLTKTSECDIFVNAKSCQAVARSLDALIADGYVVRPAAQPESIFGKIGERTLHAKFLFGASYKASSNRCLSPWLYLGSGNLTPAGFMKAMRRGSGNLEAGVVFAPDNLFWKELADTPPEQAIVNLLPLQWADELSSVAEVSTGGDMPDRSDVYLAPPVAWMRWKDDGDAAGLLEYEEANAEFEVLNPAGEPCERIAGGFRWPASRPRQATLRWTNGTEIRTSEVPVVDAFGRIAATALPPLEVTEAWWQLSSFPMPPDDDVKIEDTDLIDEPSNNAQRGSRPHITSYPVRDMMELIEQIAARQTSIDESDWVAWCCRLQQTLTLVANSKAVQTFRELQLDPLSPLRAAPFRPAFAESADTVAGRAYDDVLRSLALEWKVNDLPAIGA